MSSSSNSQRTGDDVIMHSSSLTLEQFLSLSSQPSCLLIECCGLHNPRKMAGARVLSFFELANVESLQLPQPPMSPFSPLFSASSSCLSPRSVCSSPSSSPSTPASPPLSPPLPSSSTPPFSSLHSSSSSSSSSMSASLGGDLSTSSALSCSSFISSSTSESKSDFSLALLASNSVSSTTHLDAFLPSSTAQIDYLRSKITGMRISLDKESEVLSLNAAAQTLFYKQWNDIIFVDEPTEMNHADSMQKLILDQKGWLTLPKEAFPSKQQQQQQQQQEDEQKRCSEKQAFMEKEQKELSSSSSSSSSFSASSKTHFHTFSCHPKVLIETKAVESFESYFQRVKDEVNAFVEKQIKAGTLVRRRPTAQETGILFRPRIEDAIIQQFGEELCIQTGAGSFSKICAGLYVSDWKTASSLQFLATADVRAIVNLYDSTRSHLPSSIEMKCLTVADTLTSTEKPTMLKAIAEAVPFIESQISSGKVVLLHCGSGKSRAGCVCIAFLMSHFRFTLKEALIFACYTRPVIDPNAVFWEILFDLERSAFGKNTLDLFQVDDYRTSAMLRALDDAALPVNEQQPSLATVNQSLDLSLGSSSNSSSQPFQSAPSRSN